MRESLSRGYGTYQTVKARFLPWLEPFFRWKSLETFKVLPLLKPPTGAQLGSSPVLDHRARIMKDLVFLIPKP